MKVKSESEVAQSYPTLSNPMDCSLPGSSVHGIFQARVLEWGAIGSKNITKAKLHPLSLLQNILSIFVALMSLKQNSEVSEDLMWNKGVRKLVTYLAEKILGK